MSGNGFRWTEEQFEEYQARSRAMARAGNPAAPMAESGQDKEIRDEGPERSLQNRIEAWCQEHGFHFFHDRSRGCNTPGQPDLVIALMGGRTLWVELKAGKGRMTREQRLVGAMLRRCGHEFCEIRSFRAFLGLVHGLGRGDGTEAGKGQEGA